MPLLQACEALFASTNAVKIINCSLGTGAAAEEQGELITEASTKVNQKRVMRSAYLVARVTE